MLGLSVGRTYDVQKSFEYFDKAEKLLTPNEGMSDFLMQSRAEMHVKSGDYNKSADLYYTLWKKNEKNEKAVRKIEWIERLFAGYGAVSKFDELNDDKKQRLLFLLFLYATEVTKASTAPDNSVRKYYISNTRSLLDKFHEEMFFRGLKEYPMVLPDNRKDKISIDVIKELIKSLT